MVERERTHYEGCWKSDDHPYCASRYWKEQAKDYASRYFDICKTLNKWRKECQCSKAKKTRERYIQLDKRVLFDLE